MSKIRTKSFSTLEVQRGVSRGDSRLSRRTGKEIQLAGGIFPSKGNTTSWLSGINSILVPLWPTGKDLKFFIKLHHRSILESKKPILVIFSLSNKSTQKNHYSKLFLKEGRKGERKGGREGGGEGGREGGRERRKGTQGEKKAENSPQTRAPASAAT